VHPLQGGVIRRKPRTQRRPEFPRENPISFFVRRTREALTTYIPGGLFFWRLERLRKKIENDPASKHYMDVALSPVADDEFDADLELYQTSDSAIRAADQGRARADEMRKIEVRRAAAG
jgi:hypothetical protein